MSILNRWVNPYLNRCECAEPSLPEFPADWIGEDGDDALVVCDECSRYIHVLRDGDSVVLLGVYR